MQRAGGQSDEAILGSGFNTQFPAWFRVFYPEKLDRGIIGKFGDEAVDELKASRDTVRFLRAAMPAKVEEFEREMGVLDGILACRRGEDPGGVGDEPWRPRQVASADD